jgi:hypothetical protein
LLARRFADISNRRQGDAGSMLDVAVGSHSLRTAIPSALGRQRLLRTAGR